MLLQRDATISTFTDDDQKRITLALRRAAVAIAELWDAQQEVEERESVTVESTFELLSSLAAETACGNPQTSDISLDNAWTAYLADVKVLKD